MNLQSTVACPQCQVAKLETIPEDYYFVRYTCHACGAVLKPQAGNCSVFCSYGSLPYSPKQLENP